MGNVETTGRAGNLATLEVVEGVGKSSGGACQGSDGGVALVTIVAFDDGVDEVLRGTNTIERIAASSKILETLAGGRAVIFAATHDIELSYILESIYRNLHFEEEIQGGDVRFSYKLMEGRAMTRNAIRLLGIAGYKKDVVDAAQKMAEDFAQEGEWDRI